MSEQLVTCADCGREFTFGAEEQRLFRAEGFTPPRRCKPCREARPRMKGGAG